jgi:hypothetical protein
MNDRPGGAGVGSELVKGESSVPDYGLTMALSAQVSKAPIANSPERQGESSADETTRAGVMAEGQMRAWSYFFLREKPPLLHAF